ncbi:DUF4383 domain-containing protein [Nocardia sp. NPDC051463]|uniref:DUF4383 domain-containing protein n=1 Tax=Nocardia sp. NPDC051463 TaxID=3154845 RepID=UPI0034230FC7
MANSRTSTSRRSSLQLAALGVGGVFLLVGVLGFIPGVVADYDTLAWSGHHSEARLFDLFQVSVLHNIVHLLFGLVGIVAARTTPAARAYLVGGGFIYLALSVYGLIIDRASDANFVPVNTADNWLHLGLGLAMVALGLLLPQLSPTQTRGRHYRPGLTH